MADGALKFVTEQPWGFNPESTFRIAPSFPDASMPCSTRTRPRRASAHKWSWRAAGSLRRSSGAGGSREAGPLGAGASVGLVGEAEAVAGVTPCEVARGTGLDPQALDHPGR